MLLNFLNFAKFCKKFGKLLTKNGDYRAVERSALWRSRRELSNAYLVFTCNIWLRYSREPARIWIWDIIDIRITYFRPSGRVVVAPGRVVAASVGRAVAVEPLLELPPLGPRRKVRNVPARVPRIRSAALVSIARIPPFLFTRRCFSEFCISNKHTHES